MRILAVDDDPVILDLLGTALEANGFDNITFAATAEDALELVEVSEVPYDIFLLDIMLPGISGIEVCKSIRTHEEYRATPILMITASRARDMMTRAFEAGATDFVSKPFDTMELITRIKLAAMLSDGIQRERMNTQTQTELGQLTDLSFDERFDLPAAVGVRDFLTLENNLLRRADALYEMSLFSVKIDNALGLFRGSRPAQFRTSVEAVGRAISSVMDTANTRFAYAGRGELIGVAHSHAQIDLYDMQFAANKSLAANWDSFATAQPKAPTLTFRRIDGPPAWTGKAAAAAMRSFQGRAELSAQADPFDVDGLFEQLSVRFGVA